MTHTTESLIERLRTTPPNVLKEREAAHTITELVAERDALEKTVRQYVQNFNEVEDERDALRAQLAELQSWDELPELPEADAADGMGRWFREHKVQSYARQAVAFRDATIAELREEVDALRSQTSESLELRVQAQLQICIQKVAVAATLAERERAAKVCEQDKVNRPNSKVTDAVRSMLALKIREGTP